MMMKEKSMCTIIQLKDYVVFKKILEALELMLMIVLIVMYLYNAQDLNL